MPFPFTREITVDAIASFGDKLWKELVGTDDRSTPMKITNVQLSFSGIDSMEAGQQVIEGFFKPPSSNQQKSTLPKGKASLKRKRDEDTLTDANDFDIKGGIATHQAGDQIQDEARSFAATDPGTSLPRHSFICNRCKKRIALPEVLQNASDIGDGFIDEMIEALRSEHDDFHFAQDLAKEGDGSRQVIKPDDKRRRSPPTKAKKKAAASSTKESEVKGIARFFRKS